VVWKSDSKKKRKRKKAGNKSVKKKQLKTALRLIRKESNEERENQKKE
jgi:hypothetical protein